MNLEFVTVALYTYHAHFYAPGLKLVKGPPGAYSIQIIHLSVYESIFVSPAKHSDT